MAKPFISKNMGVMGNTPHSAVFSEGKPCRMEFSPGRRLCLQKGYDFSGFYGIIFKISEMFAFLNLCFDEV